MGPPATSNFSNPIAFLPSEDARQEQAACYLFVSNLTAYMYDWLLSASQEHDIVLRSGPSRSNVIYFLSRIASFTFLITTISYTISPVSNCQGLDYAIGISAAVSMLCTSFLFLLRVRAVYHNSRSITLLFGSLWFIMLGVSILDVSELHANHDQRTQYCIYSGKDIRYFAIPSIITCTNDTLVFLAISYRLAGNAVTDGSRQARIRSFVNGDNLYSLSRSILKSGQLYYLATIAFFFVNLTMIVSPWVPITSRYILTPSYAIFTNVMACHVFRGVALGTIEDSGLTTGQIAAAFQSTLPISTNKSILRRSVSEIV